MAVIGAPARRLTPRGQATRERIVAAAADLIYTRGVQGTNNELVRKAANVSGSQLSHYFPDKESLVRAVMVWQADSMMGVRDDPPRGPLDSFAALHAWADSYLAMEVLRDGGCTFGSLAGEVMKTEPGVHDEIAAGFDRWRRIFRNGLQAMQDRGDLRRTADLDRLTHVLMAAFQGGMLITQAANDLGPLRDALYGAVGYVETFAARR